MSDTLFKKFPRFQYDTEELYSFYGNKKSVLSANLRSLQNFGIVSTAELVSGSLVSEEKNYESRVLSMVKNNGKDARVLWEVLRAAQNDFAKYHCSSNGIAPRTILKKGGDSEEVSTGEIIALLGEKLRTCNGRIMELEEEGKIDLPKEWQFYNLGYLDFATGDCVDESEYGGDFILVFDRTASNGSRVVVPFVLQAKPVYEIRPAIRDGDRKQRTALSKIDAYAGYLFYLCESSAGYASVPLVKSIQYIYPNPAECTTDSEHQFTTSLDKNSEDFASFIFGRLYGSKDWQSDSWLDNAIYQVELGNNIGLEKTRIVAFSDEPARKKVYNEMKARIKNIAQVRSIGIRP